MFIMTGAYGVAASSFSSEERLLSVRSSRKNFAWYLLLLAVACWSATGQVTPKPIQRRTTALQQGPVDLTQGPKYVSDRVLVRFRPGTSALIMQAAHRA